jgi:hypothetical protein
MLYSFDSITKQLNMKYNFYFPYGIINTIVSSAEVKNGGAIPSLPACLQGIVLN